eukprot:GHRR01003825.1.p1 GENE.GHRR01003825.1~~GHRR01003825.1.p1  ORF type:complete len:375 (+),score=89.11 GHRR01003825.1:2544-3668(+)
MLEIAAMHYGCQNHTAYADCAGDQANWCTWHEDSSKCEVSYDDADFVHLLIWSGTKVACKGSQALQQVVKCSYLTLDSDCNNKGDCTWAEGACYPSWYASLLARPKLLAALKKQVYTGDPAVWGSCAGADLYQSYSSICNHNSQDNCEKDANCHWIAEYDTAVTQNPLNFSKPCHLSTFKYPSETVFLDVSSQFLSAVFQAQKECMQGKDASICTAKVTTIGRKVLQQAAAYQASIALPLPVDAAASAPNDAASSRDDDDVFVASWAQLCNVPALLHLGSDIQPGCLSVHQLAHHQSAGCSGVTAGSSTTVSASAARGGASRRALSRPESATLGRCGTLQEAAPSVRHDLQSCTNLGTCPAKFCHCESCMCCHQ